MERGSGQVNLLFNEVTDSLDKAGAFSKGANVDAWNANPTCLPIKKNHNTSCSKTIDTRAAYSQFNVANRDSQAFGAVPLYPPPAFSTSFGGIPLPITGTRLDFGRVVCGRGSLGSHGARSPMLELSGVQFKKSAVQPFDSCESRFLMFDCEGSKRRMIFHPALLNENLALAPPKPETAVTYNQDPSLGKDSIGKGKYINSSSSALVASLGAPFSIYNPHTQPTNANMTFINHTSDNLVTTFSAFRDIAETNNDFNQLDFSAELSNFPHEDTEDLEALLSYDEDEMSSTGHSPSDITRQMSFVESHSSQACNQRNSKRKKREWEDHVDDDDDDDMCSTGTSGKVEAAGIEAAHSQEGVAFQVTARSNCLGYTKKDLTACDVVVSDEISSSSSSNNKKSHSMRQWQQPDQQSKKEKMRRILHLLRGILPGGESMDSSFVLDQTIQYVKTLQFEVQKLQAGKLLKL